MNIIHGSYPRGKAAVFTAFMQAIDGFNDPGTLFLAFPIVEIMGVTSAIDALLISPNVGIVAIDLISDVVLDAESTLKRQDDIYVGLQSRLIKHDSLRIDRRQLAFEIITISFAPFAKNKPEHPPAGIAFEKDELMASILGVKTSSSISDKIVKQVTAVVQGVDKLSRSLKNPCFSTRFSPALCSKG